MKISTTIKNKILADLKERSIKNNLGPMAKSGPSSQEYDYGFYASTLQDFSNKIFVVTKKMLFENSQLKDEVYVVYPYDANGNFITGMDEMMFNGSFHKSRIKIE